MTDTGDKTHAPTPRRREQARQAGEVAQSQDIGSVMLLVGSLAALLLTGGELLEFLSGLLRAALGGEGWKPWLDGGDGRQLVALQWNTLMAALARLLLPILAGAALMTAAVQWLQTGFLFRPQRILPDASRVSPAAGWQRIFSGSSYARLTLGMGKVVVVASVAATSLWMRREQLAELAAFELPHLAGQIWQIALVTCLQMAAALAVLAVADYAWQRWLLERRLSMTTQELREELRELQGDPQVAARRRAVRQSQAGAANQEAPRGGTARTAAPGSPPASVSSIDAVR